MTESKIIIRPTHPADHARVEQVRAAAFAPVFASFRHILGDDIYEIAQRNEDEAQGELLAGLFAEDSEWHLHVAELDGVIAGFVSWQENLENSVGEIGLNAVDPTLQARGIGSRLYDFALENMRAAGLQVATVATGGDPAHAPARRAYEKAGFDVSVPSVWMCRRL